MALRVEKGPVGGNSETQPLPADRLDTTVEKARVFGQDEFLRQNALWRYLDYESFNGAFDGREFFSIYSKDSEVPLIIDKRWVKHIDFFGGAFKFQEPMRTYQQKTMAEFVLAQMVAVEKEQLAALQKGYDNMVNKAPEERAERFSESWDLILKTTGDVNYVKQLIHDTLEIEQQNNDGTVLKQVLLGCVMNKHEASINKFSEKIEDLKKLSLESLYPCLEALCSKSKEYDLFQKMLYEKIVELLCIVMRDKITFYDLNLTALEQLYDKYKLVVELDEVINGIFSAEYLYRISNSGLLHSGHEEYDSHEKLSRIRHIDFKGKDTVKTETILSAINCALKLKHFKFENLKSITWSKRNRYCSLLSPATENYRTMTEIIMHFPEITIKFK